MRESASTKAQRLLTEGRVVVENAGPGHFVATVRGSGDIHLVQYARGGWSCSCPCRTTCSHLLAVKLVSAPAYSRLISPPHPVPVGAS